MRSALSVQTPSSSKGLVDAHWLKEWTPESSDARSDGELNRRQRTEI